MATPTRFGPEFLVNTTTNSDQYGPAITGLANGRFVVTYTDTSGNAPDLSSLCSRAQIFNADGSKFGTEFVVNTTRENSQYLPEIAALSGGGFVVAFQDFSQLTGPTGADIRVQAFAAGGGRAGTEGLAPATLSGAQTEPVIAGLRFGRYVVAWTDSSGTGGDTSSDAIRSQVFNADGSRFGAERLVNTTTLGQQIDPSVTALANGNYVVSWASHGADAGGQPVNSVNAQVFRPNGSKIGGEYVGNTTSGNFAGQSEPDITGLDGGRYVLTWTNVNLFDTNIMGQAFNRNGTTAGAAFTVNTTTANAQFDSTVTKLADGGFVVSWVDQGTFTGTGFDPEIRAQAFRAGGAHNGSEFRVHSNSTGLQRAPSVTGLADGRFVVAWEDLGGGPGDATFAVRAQIFDARLAAISLPGTKGSDSYVGTGLDDTLSGGAGNDVLSGGAGADILRGGLGQDRLTGDPGADRFIFLSAAEAGIGPGADRITDFTSLSDTLDFSAFMAGGHFTGSTGFVAGAGPQISYNPALGLLQGDVTGDGSADFAFRLLGTPTVHAADFVF